MDSAKIVELTRSFFPKLLWKRNKQTFLELVVQTEKALAG